MTIPDSAAKETEVQTLPEARTALEQSGLHVSKSGENALWIADEVRDVGRGLRIAQASCSLIGTEGKWVAVFPTEGNFVFERPGSLAELVRFIQVVFAHFRQRGGKLSEAVKECVADADKFLVA